MRQSKFIHATTFRRRLFGDKEVEDPGGHRYGWFVGRFKWHLPDDRPHSDGGSIEETVRTYVTGEARVACQELGVWRDDPFHGPSALVGAWTATQTTEAEFWERVADALEKLVVRSGA
ncbi:hypothetical protein Daura_30315 [Dactylosporangium aurantiacum]|uniref:Uncharacterized protein n=1 Tax=Dactylosporangium aurantiacum TaxID=35754 RepID=A0A9Q9IDA2_9ACTN|nr:hypothetical protein [Dactylosporangium aurantiacum]MDG6108693.1 hypothetical protein [Dactylosporangium aurantiacum]UWZ51058.1 hypothetical protein Daura_30315 [Dactylosporangium aurantiacum]